MKRIAPLSRFGFGTGRFLPTNNPSTLARYRGALVAALDGGLLHVDCAPNYGAGLAELLLGECLEQGVARRENLTISTKIGHFTDPVVGDLESYARSLESLRHVSPVGTERLSRTFIVSQCRASLERLRLSGVDVLYLHEPEEVVDLTSRTARERWLPDAFETLERLRSDGSCRHYGMAFSQDVHMLDERQTMLDHIVSLAERVGGSSHGLEFVQAPFSIGKTDALWPDDGARGPGLIEAARRCGLQFVASAALNRLILPARALQHMQQVLPGVEKPALVALGFILLLDDVSCALFGSTDAEHVREICTALSGGKVFASPTLSRGQNPERAATSRGAFS